LRGSCKNNAQGAEPLATSDASETIADGGALDATRGAADAVADAENVLPGQFPGFVNPSFEITSGAPGGGLISSFVVQVSPWLGCSPPGFGPGAYRQADLRADTSAGTPTAAELIAPSEGSALLVTTPDGTSTAQTLTTNLTAGTRYAFLVDIAASEGESDLTLLVQGSSGCLSPEALTTSAPAVPGEWRAVCVTFTPDKPYSSLMLTAVAATTPTSARLFVDNIRADPSCQ